MSRPLIPLGERHFRRALAEFVVHYHRERNHQGLGNELIGMSEASSATGRFDGARVLAAFSITTIVPLNPTYRDRRAELSDTTRSTTS